MNKQAEKEREEVMISGEVFKGLSKQYVEKQNELEMLKFKIDQQRRELERLQMS